MSGPSPDTNQRQAWMRTLATAPTAELTRRWQAWQAERQFHFEAVRGPERGLVMVTGRIDSGGDRFNLGEATVTRATVRVRDLPEAIGTSYVLGSDTDHAWIAACVDALLVEGTHREALTEAIITPLTEAIAAADAAAQQRARATQVDFFTVSREHA